MDLKRVQHFGGETVVAGEALRVLRSRFREICGLQSLPDETEVTSAEVTAIFVLCYFVFNGRSAPREIRMDRVMRDIDDFINGREGLSYPTLSVYHHRKQRPVEESQIPPTHREFFRQVSEMRGETPFGPEDLKLSPLLFRAPAA